MAQHKFCDYLLQYLYEILQGHNLITIAWITRLAWTCCFKATFLASLLRKRQQAGWSVRPKIAEYGVSDFANTCAVMPYICRHDAYPQQAAGRGGPEGGSQRGDGQPSAQWQGRGLQRHQGGRADRARRARLRAADPVAR